MAHNRGSLSIAGGGYGTQEPDPPPWLDPPETEGKRLQEIVDFLVERGATIRAEHIEQMAAAYLLKTDVDPRRVELVEDRRGTTPVWYFRERGDCDGRAKG